MNAELINFKKDKVGSIEVPETVFGVKWNAALVKQALLAQLANRRLPWAHAKDRSEVRGGGRKPWRQKGTGRARHGSTRSPLWVGGGKAHGPNKERDYTQKINKKMKRLAVMAVLSKKFKDGEVTFMDTLTLEAPKTNPLAKNLMQVVAVNKKTKKFDVVMIPDGENKNIYRAAKNLNKAKALSPEALNVYDLLNHKHILIDQNAIAVIEKHYSTKK